MNWIGWNNITSKSICTNTHFNTGKQRHKSPYRQHFELLYQITLVLLCCTVHRPDWQVSVWNVPHHCLLRFVIFALEKQREKKNNAVANEACFTGTLMEQRLEKKQWSALFKIWKNSKQKEGKGLFLLQGELISFLLSTKYTCVKRKKGTPKQQPAFKWAKRNNTLAPWCRSPLLK